MPSFRNSYERLLENDRLSGPWRDEMMEIRKGHQQYRYLNVAQPIKHALGLANSCVSKSVTLLYLYWEPKNAADLDEMNAHELELQSFKTRVAGGFPRFRATTYRHLWAQWKRMDRPTWLREHVDNLSRRYDVAI